MLNANLSLFQNKVSLSWYFERQHSMQTFYFFFQERETECVSNLLQSNTILGSVTCCLLHHPGCNTYMVQPLHTINIQTDRKDSVVILTWAPQTCGTDLALHPTTCWVTFSDPVLILMLLNHSGMEEFPNQTTPNIQTVKSSLVADSPWSVRSPNHTLFKLGNWGMKVLALIQTVPHGRL